jgi:hypothetical protein
MRIILQVPAGRLRRWQLDLGERLSCTIPGAQIGILPIPSPGPGSGACEMLIALERLVQRRPASCADRIDAPTGAAPDAASADAVIDLTGEQSPPTEARTLRLLFDGHAAEDQLFAALLENRMPEVAVEDVATATILASGIPAAEGARGFIGMVENCTARVATLIAATLGRAGAERNCIGRARRAPAASGVMRFAARSLAHAAARRVYEFCCLAPHWRIGWRFNEGPGVWDRHDLAGPRWQILADPGDRFFADPVPVEWEGRTFVFFEDWDHRLGKAAISAVEFDARGPVGRVVRVLEERWHLSYPFIMPHAGTLFLIPESSARKEVIIYRLVKFPDRWERAAVLLSGVEASDATIVAHQGRLYMFAATRDGAGAVSDTLSIFIAEDLFGPWRPHAANPILIDAAGARPAGNFVRRGERLFRPVQDCRAGYGTALGLAEVTRLDEVGYGQEMRSILRPGPLWPGRKLHTLNRTGRLECIDGAVVTPRNGIVSNVVRSLSDPRARPRACALP